MVDWLFLLAVGAIGWGISLATYPLVASLARWPRGALQVDFPALPVLIGVLAAGTGYYFASARDDEVALWIILAFGGLLAVFWTGFLRVGSQLSLILAPLAALLLIVGWLREPLG